MPEARAVEVLAGCVSTLDQAIDRLAQVQAENAELLKMTREALDAIAMQKQLHDLTVRQASMFVEDMRFVARSICATIEQGQAIDPVKLYRFALEMIRSTTELRAMFDQSPAPPRERWGLES